MWVAKKILLSLIFSFSFTFTIMYFVESILYTVKPSWLEGDFTSIGLIMWWVLFGLFFLSALSSFFWLINLSSGFWLWKIPALLILPFSIPFLIIDYLDSKNGQNVEKIINDKNNQQISLVMLLVITGINVLIVLLLISFLPVPILISKWFWFLLLIPLSMICGTTFLLFNYFYPNKILTWLSCLGLTLNWALLFLHIIDKKQINYFFKPSKNVANEQKDI